MSYSISTVGNQIMTSNNLQSQQTTLAQLNQQLASNQKYSNLTEYNPVDAKDLLSFQNAITQRQAYISGMQSVSARLTIYDSTMTDMESVAQQAQQLASSNQTLDSTSSGEIGAQATAFLQQVENDLNQQVSGRYIYAGSRYSTPPVGDLTQVAAPTLPFTTVTSPALPAYDSNYSTDSFTVNSKPTGNFTVGNTSIPWSAIATGNVTSVSVNGVSQAVNVTGLATGSNLTPTQIASNLSLTINQIASQVTGGSSAATMSSTVSGTGVTFAFSGAPAAVTPDAGGIASEITWSDAGQDAGTTAITIGQSAAAWTQDTATLDQNYNVSYGVTSTNPAFQQLIAGLSLISAASKETDPTTYATDMSQASTILSNALTAIQTVHAGVAGNINLVNTETSTQNSDVTSLQNQVSNIQSVDMTQVGTELSLLQTQLQASYSASASLLQDTILKYL
jgi:flagellar hook-associated protein 3 FlgL